MAYDEQHAEILRLTISDLDGVTEKRMFGGLCFLHNGNMLCGVHKDGAMARVGKELEAAALRLNGVAPLSFTGRRMGGIVEMTASAIETPDILDAVLELAREFVGSLPAK